MVYKKEVVREEMDDGGLIDQGSWCRILMQTLRVRRGGAMPPYFLVEWEISLEDNKYI